jgi:hypothetical protein
MHHRALAVVATCVVMGIAAAPARAAGAPAVGDTYVYRVINQYNKEPRGELRFRTVTAGESGSTVEVTGSPGSGAASTHVHTRDGNWLRHPLESRGQLVDYTFATPYPAYAFPLDVGKSWSVKVKASAADGGRARTVRVDGKVLRSERVRVPAGEFDTVVIQRTAYAGDADQAYTETRTNETEWYAPALGRAVRVEKISEWRDIGMCGRGVRCEMRGDWDLVELIEARAAKR